MARGVARGVAGGVAGVWLGARPEARQQDMTRCADWGRGLWVLPGCEDSGRGLMAWTGDVAWTWSEGEARRRDLEV